MQCIGDIGIGIAFCEAESLRDWECIRGLDRSKVRRWYHTATTCGNFYWCSSLCFNVHSHPIRSDRHNQSTMQILTKSSQTDLLQTVLTCDNNQRERALIKTAERHLWKSLHRHKWAPFFEGITSPPPPALTRVYLLYLCHNNRKSDLSVVDSRTELRLWRISQ